MRPGAAGALHWSTPVSAPGAPGVSFVLGPAVELGRSDDLARAARQSWRFARAPEALAACRHALRLEARGSAEMPPRARLSLFLRTLAGVLEAVPCRALYWRPSLQIVDPERFREAYAAGEPHSFLCGPINVRLFGSAGRGEDQVMDTVGLEPFGLPDLQCHFRALEPRDVAAVLYNTALAFLADGAAAAAGAAVSGPGPAWAHRRDWALADPPREVVDLEPPSPGSRRLAVRGA